MDFLKQHAKCLILLLVLLAGIIITAPYANFQDHLAQGDHGRDLYAAQAVYRGDLPYRDFWWVYGPLTPYYYGLFFKIFGIQISSMILGKLILLILGGVLMCAAMMEIVSGLAALICSCWFMLFQSDFFFTYNHIAGIAMLLGVVWGLLAYIKGPSIKVLWRTLAFIFVLCLIKINFGLAALAMAVITVAISDSVRHTAMDRDKRSFYAIAFIGLPSVIFIIYFSLLHGLSAIEIRQCLPYKDGDQPYSTTPWVAISDFLQITWQKIKSTWMNKIFALIIYASLLRCIYLFIENKLSSARRMNLLLSFGMLCLFYVFNSHEYIKSGVWYREFWAQPLSIMLTFLIIDTACQSFPQVVRKIIFTFIGGIAIYCWFITMTSVNAVKIEKQFLSLPRGGIYISNSPSWIGTVEQTTAFLDKTLKPNELFFALPYDCLYYYLTDKKSPTRQLIFFEHIKIPPEQESSVIAELKKNHVNYVLLSNRAFVKQELGLGFLGVTYCPLIGKYIRDNFTPIARFGDWTNEAGWSWNHGTLILKRKNPI